MGKINRDTTLAEILEWPEAEKILSKYNLPCLGCPFAKMEMENLKIGEVCRMYGIDVEKLLKELNESCPVRNSKSKNPR
jgi:hybrid cluster-associated redox disulfide protein